MLVPRRVRASPCPIEDTLKQHALIFYADILSWTSTCTGCVLLWRKPLSSSSVAMKSRISSTTYDKAFGMHICHSKSTNCLPSSWEGGRFLLPTPKNLEKKRKTRPGTPGQCRHQNGSSFDLRKNYRCNKEAGEQSREPSTVSFFKTFHCSWYKSFENLCL